MGHRDVLIIGGNTPQRVLSKVAALLISEGHKVNVGTYEDVGDVPFIPDCIEPNGFEAVKNKRNKRWLKRKPRIGAT